VTAPSKPFGRVLVCVTEDWFVLSHFKPLLRALLRVADEVVVAARDNGRLAEVAALGVRTIAFDFARKSTAPHVVVATARRFRHLIETERPDAVHMIALKPIVLGALALRGKPATAVGVHLTGLGHLAVTTTPFGRLLRGAALSQVRALLRRPNAHLFVENEDDLVFARPSNSHHGTASHDSATSHDDATSHQYAATLLGGAGVDPAHFAALPQGDGPLTIAYVGRLVRSKGVDVLINAVRLLKAAGVPVHLSLYGDIDADNPDAVTRSEIELWQRDGLASWAGHVTDVRIAWAKADVAVAPSRGGEGLPRSVLEAAACARALVATDVPGCRRFIRNGIDGLLVAPNDAVALSDALARLAGDPSLRRTLAAAARQRVLDGFTEHHVEAMVEKAYRERLSVR
jgi:glycosyltransferase involved in cell wall biosynthesis